MHGNIPNKVLNAAPSRELYRSGPGEGNILRPRWSQFCGSVITRRLHRVTNSGKAKILRDKPVTINLPIPPGHAAASVRCVKPFRRRPTMQLVGLRHEVSLTPPCLGVPVALNAFCRPAQSIAATVGPVDACTCVTRKKVHRPIRHK